MPGHLRNWSTRRLATRIEAPTNTPIGKQLLSLLPAGAVRLEHIERPARRWGSLSGATDTFDLNGDGRADVILETSKTVGANPVAGPSSLTIARPGAQREQRYVAWSAGQVDSLYDGDGTNGTSLRDTDGDGRVDEAHLTGSDRGSFTLDGFPGTPLDFRTLEPVRVEPGKLPAQVTARELKDTDGDGSFDQESVGGLWWRTDD